MLLEDRLGRPRHAGARAEPGAGPLEPGAQRLEPLPRRLDGVAAGLGISRLLPGGVIPAQPEALGVGEWGGTSADDIGGPVRAASRGTLGHRLPGGRVLLQSVLEEAVFPA